MKKLQQLTKEINELTLRIEQDYPELYQYLDENPITISYSDQSELTVNSFSEYLDSLKSILERYIESHK
ncbi:hypothetical protein BC962_0585 [Gillisia mitskevichiae]|uniref:Uncharacterized protein n=2 Tax=Flavobacteriaceae TaxID=49546 RepID=A0A4Q0P7Q8_9FLAO|nr:hypothetical protein [Gillisia mitskevichiae]RKS55618.1 hypothetical protein BC962_0585 [Gillisia mitskevichiae]RXG22750.1 hypothetical protein DSM00_1853 [Leeuwenhoekiella aequorea]HEA30547.1 hypothetical protein [Leeuwenhoekiella sp.]